MNELTVKNVDVFGDSITAVKDKDGNIWAGVSHFCKALGMSDKQRDNQVAKVQKDKTLKRGTLKFQEGVFDQNNEAVGIRIDFIPLWLAKVPVTERMESEHPELAEKLLNYQLNAKDVLAAAFLPVKFEQPANQQGTPIRLYKNNKWYILTVGDDVYSLNPCEALTISNCVAAMLDNSVEQIEGVVRALIKRFKRDCELKCIDECTAPKCVKQSLNLEGGAAV